MSENISYESLKVPQLKKLLSERKLKTIGKKNELIERLKAYDIQLKKESGLILLFCKTFIGRYCDIWINKTSTILQLKNKIHEEMGAPINNIILEYGYGNEQRIKLEDDKHLYDYNIMHESTIFIFVSLRKK